VSEIYSPVAGEISAINDAVISNPESINSSPYGAGWLFEIDAVSQADMAALLDDQAYAKMTAAD
jgi:glycine cleavage system H protein